MEDKKFKSQGKRRNHEIHIVQIQNHRWSYLHQYRRVDNCSHHSPSSPSLFIHQMMGNCRRRRNYRQTKSMRRINCRERQKRRSCSNKRETKRHDEWKEASSGESKGEEWMDAWLISFVCFPCTHFFRGNFVKSSIIFSFSFFLLL